MCKVSDIDERIEEELLVHRYTFASLIDENLSLYQLRSALDHLKATSSIALGHEMATSPPWRLRNCKLAPDRSSKV